ncbi:MAG: hypothetical protein Q9220_005372 [cf. Caloplaca sp. 1 TL-2023]
MPEPMDALKSFTHLTDNIPEWLTKLDELAAQVSEQYSRFARMSQSEFTQIRLSKKHDSTESLRPPKEDLDPPTPVAEPSVPPTGIPLASQPQANANLIVKDIKRKRKPGSAELSAASGPQRYRTRSMVIVYYDSSIQEAFEAIVRNVAGARNNLRKGKTAASFKVRMASMGMHDDESDGYTVLNPKLIIRRASPPSQFNMSPAFDRADNDLEAAQNLCEVAAHQFLRDGDCGEEIAGARKRFEECLKIAEAERTKLQAEDTEDKETDQASRPPVKTTGDSVPVAANKMEVPRIPTVPTLTSNGTIEVDNDSDASSVHLDMTSFRRTRRV